MKKKLFFLAIAGGLLISGCVRYKSEEKLPILGPKEPIEKTVDGKLVVDTLYHTIPEFSFTNQNGEEVTEKEYQGKYYVTDFFFTSCPTICPLMTNNLLKVYEAFSEEKDLRILSHTIDVRHDSVPVLKAYAEKLEVKAPRWNFVTGEKEEIYGIAEKYLVSAMEDENAPGGYIHSGAIVLIDPEGRIRGYYDGTQEKDIQRLIRHLKVIYEQEQA